LTFDPDEGRVYSQLFSGLSAYQVAGSWHIGWAESSGCEDCRYSGVPVPADGQPASIIVGNVMYAVLAESENPDIAAEWINNPELGILPQWRKDPQKLWQIYNDMLTEILTTDDPVMDIMDSAQAAADEVMQE